MRLADHAPPAAFARGASHAPPLQENKLQQELGALACLADSDPKQARTFLADAIDGFGDLAGLGESAGGSDVIDAAAKTEAAKSRVLLSRFLAAPGRREFAAARDELRAAAEVFKALEDEDGANEVEAEMKALDDAEKAGK